MKKEHVEETKKSYAHDYRYIAMSEETLKDMLEGFMESLGCDHTCSPNCRKKGYDCRCGEYHF